tara:strand:- start:28850 stop:31306 length:2457 start_codon:yes stop_codon:yes gene_type:complete
VGCSRKKDKFLNKSLHSLTTKYNFLFNGNNLYAEGLEDLEREVNENFWSLIPVEKFNFYKPEDEERETNFTRAEEKATLAIQKHSMNIGGKEKNPTMDQAYFLLGKARYFDNRFIPAMEAFNYILRKHPSSDNLNMVKIWKEKINIRLDQNQFAIDNLKKILEYDNVLIQERSMANAYLAQAFVNLQQLDSAAYYLNISNNQSNNLRNNPKNKFLLAQLYQELDSMDMAIDQYSQIIKLNRKIPRKFYVHSFLNRSKASDSIENSILQLKTLIENYENNEFFDVIYYNIAKLYLKKNINEEIKEKQLFKTSDSLAAVFFNKSLATDPDDEILSSKIYSELADLNFRNKEYLIAGLYYDSTLSELNNKSKEFRMIKKKRANLEDLIFYENIAKESDSVRDLINMPNNKREQFFREHIAKLKNKKKSSKNKNLNTGSSNSIITNLDSESALFYFYNTTAVAYGKNDFKNRWGNRRLEDNWRWFASGINQEKIKSQNTQNNINQDSIYSLDYYLKLIPGDSIQIDSINNIRNDAYFRLGSIYKDQFEEYQISNTKLFALLKNNPKKALIPPAKYFIYKNWLALDSLIQAEKVKKDIIKNYNDSKYAAILLNPQAEFKVIEKAEEIYEKLYFAYSDQKYLEVIDGCNENIANYSGDSIVPKFEFLKALAIAKVYGFKAYEKALNFIKLNYSTTIEGKKAEIILTEVLPTLKNDQFVDNMLSNNYKIIYQFDSNSIDKIESQKEDLRKYINNIDYLDLNISQDFYNNIITFVVVHGLKSYDGSLGLSERLENSIDIQADSFFVISSENYKTIQIHKNLENFDK